MADNNEPRSIVSLKDYVDTRFEAVDRATCLMQQALEKRLDTMTEIRGSMRDLQALMATRAELEAKEAVINTELRQLRDFRVALEAKASQQSVNVALALALLGLVLSAIKLFAN